MHSSIQFIPLSLRCQLIATKTFPALHKSFFAHPSGLVNLALIGCMLVKRCVDSRSL